VKDNQNNSWDILSVANLKGLELSQLQEGVFRLLRCRLVSLLVAYFVGMIIS